MLNKYNQPLYTSVETSPINRVTEANLHQLTNDRYFLTTIFATYIQDATLPVINGVVTPLSRVK